MNIRFIIIAFFCVCQAVYAFPSRVTFDAKHNCEIRLLKASNSCEDIISFMENQYGIPKGLLSAISFVESSHHLWTINVKGKPYKFDTKAKALNFINGKVKSGVTWMDIGCMQIHYRAHKKYFPNVADLLDPFKNIEYSAAFLTYLKGRFGTWERAVKFYHSSTAHHQNRYIKEVKKAWKKTSSVVSGFKKHAYSLVGNGSTRKITRKNYHISSSPKMQYISLSKRDIRARATELVSS